ncbi:Chromatin structure-remodeling complex RSC30 [Gossypium arboreum]|uniref:Chromatin structure-remodeling complex RSC30 n=1 Tax=Gossypium arboreum TaxID=29729 RepID=A0A0B0NW22_GOSAR|nr:Chromatin structure-remodeling complex RSC30 [Gossypium arboreum]
MAKSKMKRHSLCNLPSPFFSSVKNKTPVSANQETHFLPVSTLQEPLPLLESRVRRANNHHTARTLPLYLPARSAISSLLIHQDLHRIRCLLYLESRMLVTPSFFRHRMSNFVGFPCLRIMVSASPSMQMP